MYSAEALMWKNKQIKSLENVYSHAYMKIFKTFDKKIIEYFQFSMGYLPFTFLLACSGAPRGGADGVQAPPQEMFCNFFY